MANIGDLAVKLSADIADFKGKIAEAESSVSGFKDKVSNHLNVINGLFAGMLAGFTLNALKGELLGVAENMNKLKDAAEGTGSSVEKLSALRAVASSTGDSFDTVISAVDKLNQALKKADGENAVSQALKAIGLNAEDLKRIDPAEALHTVAVALNNYADDGDKARLMQVLLGKSARELAPYIKDLGEVSELHSKATKEQTEQAEELSKKLIEIKRIFSGISKALATEALPVVLDITKAFTDTAEKSDVLGAKASGLGIVFKGIAIAVLEAKYVITAIGKEIGVVAAQISAAMRGDWKGAFGIGGMGDQAKAEAEQLRAQHDKQLQAILDAGSKKPTSAPDTRKSVGSITDDSEGSKKAKTSRTPRDKTYTDSLADEAKTYQTVFADLTKAQLELDATDQNYTRTQKRMLEVMTDPKWLTMPEQWRAEIAARAEIVIASEKEAEAKKKLADAQKVVGAALSDADSSIESQRKQMEQLVLVYEQGLLSVEQFNRAAQQISGINKSVEAQNKTVRDLTGQTADEDKKSKRDLLDQAREKGRNNEAGGITEDQYQKGLEAIKDTKDNLIDLKLVANDAAKGMTDAFMQFASGAKSSFGDFAKSFLANIAKMIAQTLILKAIQAGANSLAGMGGMLGSLGTALGGKVASANGNVFAGGHLLPFANGGIVSQPTTFPLSNGSTGLMGEAGIEGIFPLTRVNGKLGVAAVGAGSTTNTTVNQITVNVQGGQTNDQTGNAVAEKVVRAIARQEIMNSRRVGGINNPIAIGA